MEYIYDNRIQKKETMKELVILCFIIALSQSVEQEMGEDGCMIECASMMFFTCDICYAKCAGKPERFHNCTNFYCAEMYVDYEGDTQCLRWAYD